MRILLFIALLFTSLIAHAEDYAQDRADLQRLLEERAARFNSYTYSLKQRSGIFGNQTKGDVRKTNEVLIQIVNTDNKLIDAMNRFMNYKTFEKTNINFDAARVKEKLEQSMFITDTLTKQMNKMEADKKRLRSTNIKLQGLVYLLFAGLGTLAYFYYRLKRRTEEV